MSILPDTMIHEILDWCIRDRNVTVLRVCKKWHSIGEGTSSYTHKRALYTLARTVLSLSIREKAQSFLSLGGNKSRMTTRTYNSNTCWLTLRHDTTKEGIYWEGRSDLTKFIRPEDIDVKSSTQFITDTHQATLVIFNIIHEIDERGLINGNINNDLYITISVVEEPDLISDAFTTYLRNNSVILNKVRPNSPTTYMSINAHEALRFISQNNEEFVAQLVRFELYRTTLAMLSQKISYSIWRPCSIV
jgi:hypothetical protein